MQEFYIEIPKKNCTTFKLKKNYLDIKKGFYSIKFKSNSYSLNYENLQKEHSLLNGLDKVINEMCKIYQIDNLWIFAKSYADKSKNKNKKYTLQINYFYNNIYYYKFNKVENVYLINKTNIKTLYLKDYKFKNRDLIYLRSNFIGEEIFKIFLDLNYIDISNKNFGILEGEILNEKNGEYRRTDIYITFCKNN